MTTDQEPLEAPIPERIAVEHSPNGLVFTYNWFSWMYIPRGLNSPDEVRFFERQIEEQLGIQDKPVEGEMHR